MSNATFQNQPAVRLTMGDAEAWFAPQAGARLLTWRRNGQAWIHWPDDADWSMPAKVRGGNPVLFPFIARHMVDGKVGLWREGGCEGGALHKLPMHGFARDLPFAVSAQSATRLVMSLEDNEVTRRGYPFTFRFDVEYELGVDTLTATLRTTNRGSSPLPYYAGHHFYFPVAAAERMDWRVEMQSSGGTTQNEDGSMTDHGVLEGPWTLDRPELIDRMHLRDGSNGECRWIHKSGRGIRFDLDVPGSIPWHAVTTWTQTAESPFYCVEPWLGLPNAIHHGRWLRWLPPGMTETAVCVLQVLDDL